ncbi:MAG: hypothetical protein H7A37_02655 [Chlamydiales bacterium]|nr:hypothetical protein [Chlamydiales bacterium]
MIFGNLKDLHFASASKTMARYHRQKSLMNMKRLLLITLLLFTGCASSTPEKSKSQLHEIPGRLSEGRSIYRVYAPIEWIRIDTPFEHLEDTMEPLCRFSIERGKAIVYIHNFPQSEIRNRISPESQVTRWQKQFDFVEDLTIIPQAFAGFSGLRMDGSGEVNSEPKSMIAWAMQLNSDYFYRLRSADQRGDYTIKAVGEPAFVESRKDEIAAFARTFELIDEIPEIQ